MTTESRMDIFRSLSATLLALSLVSRSRKLCSVILRCLYRSSLVYTGCFINSVTILSLYIIKISTSNCLTSKYYKDIMICILFGIKIDPYFHNLSLVCENLKKEQFLWCVQNNVTVRVFKTEGPIIPTQLQAAHIAYDFLSILWLLYETM